MVKFKKNILTHNISKNKPPKRSKNKKTRNIVYITVAIGFVAILMVVLYYLSEPKDTNRANQNENIVSLVENKPLADKDTEEVQKETDSSNLVQNKKLIPSYEELLNSTDILFSKIGSTVDGQILHRDLLVPFLIEYMKEKLVRFEHIYFTIQYLSKSLSDIIAVVPEKSNMQTVYYYQALFIYYRIILETNRLINEENLETIDLSPKEFLEVKYILQEAFLYDILVGITKIAKNYKNMVIKRVEKQNKRNLNITLGKKVIQQFEDLKSKLFVKTDENIGIKYEDKEIKSENIIGNISLLKRFLSLNIFLILLDFFEVDRELNIHEINEHVVNTIKFSSEEDSHENDKEVILKESIEKCGNIFKMINDLKDINKGLIKLEEAYDLNENCCDYIYNIIDLKHQ